MVERNRRELYENLMRGAAERMHLQSQRVLERQQAALESYGVKLNSIRLSRADEAQCMIEQIDLEVSRLSRRMLRTSRIEKRIEFKAAIVHLRELREQISGGKKRKPPESGLAVPAVPPGGPRPKQGGAAAPLEFDS
ncbi:hypothetical protein [Porphyrobacter sp. AAP60]|uniref:hypothetical protein n=1 Tax=Porphyrobacter sp. AAP60 TaxID=1523423 RepID=UPI0006B9ED3E|nr:hypothetical protein [Porphyrobacter sp. AAP60]KPF63874.1 hypothetical protein IP79_08645 [Porphyrobacter sp. AAP60]